MSWRYVILTCSVSHGHDSEQGIVSLYFIIPPPPSQFVNRAKYPVAAANKLIHTFGQDILFAYDIGCTFSAMLSKSGIGELVHDSNFRCCTGSFHGAAHN